MTPSDWKSSVNSVPISFKGDPETVKVPYSGWYGLCFRGVECQCVYASSDRECDKLLLRLPQRLGKDAISSLEIGTLIYLEKGSNVQVRRESSCDVHADQDAPFAWRLVLQSAQAARDSTSAPKKKLICAACRRMFSSISDIQQHVQSMHRTVDPNSIWQQPLQVEYQDESLVVIDKPQGMSVMGDKGGKTLCRSDLLFALAGKSKDALIKPVHVHRLDAPTGGLLVLAKTKTAERQLKSSFETRSCRKRYLALALGRIEPDEGTIEQPISGKHAVTNYNVVQHARCIDDMAQDGWVTLVDLYPATGRKHQLRRHLKHIGHPIWGDKRYAPYRKRKADSDETNGSNDESMDRAELVHSTTVEQDPHSRLCLWAMEISFPHPDTGNEVSVSLEDRPEWLTLLLDYEGKLVKDQEHD